jgi:hypothetical protein
VIFKIRRFTVTALILCVCVIAALSVNLKRQYALAGARVQTLPQIILDAGHGGLTNTTD